MLGTICTKILDQLAAAKQGLPLCILETGTSYIMYTERGELDLRERSTVAIAQWASRQKCNVDFYSVDISAQHQQDCANKLAELGLLQHVNMLCGHGPDVLRREPLQYDFVLLDADSGGVTTLAEFEAVYHNMRRPGVIVVDDAFKPANVNKAQFVIPRAQEYGHAITAFYNQAVAISFGADEIIRKARG